MRPPGVDLIDVVLGCVHRSMRDEWFGTHARLLPAQPWMAWFPKLKGFAGVLTWAADSDLFIDESAGFARCIPNEEDAGWVAMGIAKNA